MAQKNTIIIDGKEFILDYVNGRIYRDIALIPEGTPGYFPMKGEEEYPFRKIKNELYFQMGKKFYKILNNKDVSEITKAEYDENNEYILINRNINDSNVVKNYKDYVIAIIIEEIMQDRYNQKRSISVLNIALISRFSQILNPKINLDVDNLVRKIMLELPAWIKRDKKKKHIKEAYDKIVQEDREFIRLLLDSIYESNKGNFDALYDSLLEQHLPRKDNPNKEETKKIKREKHEVKLTLPARGARLAPPVSTVLGPTKIDIHKFCKDFNEWSKNLEGKVEFGVVVYDDLSYDILTKEEMEHRRMVGIVALLKLLYDPIRVQLDDDKSLINDEQKNPISIIRQKLETLYKESGGNPTGGEIIPIEELDCAIGKGRDLHFNQNEICYYDEKGFIHIKGTEENFVSKSHVQLKGKNLVVLADIKEGSEEFKYLSNIIKKIDSILQPQNKTHPSK